MTNGRITKTKKNRSIMRSHYKKKKKNFCIERSENIRERKKNDTKRIVERWKAKLLGISS